MEYEFLFITKGGITTTSSSTSRPRRCSNASPIIRTHIEDLGSWASALAICMASMAEMCPSRP